jgi:uncharacterized repeat protein (TIGR03843 family)
VSDPGGDGPTTLDDGEPAPARDSLPLDRVLSVLTNGEMELLGLMPGASNYTFLAEVCDAGTSMLAVYKPRKGEAPLWDFPEGTLADREVAAYLLAADVGWPRVPPTVLRDGPHGPGSVQLFIEADPDEHYFTLRRKRLRDFAPVAAFDVVTNNADRKSGHCLLDADGAIWLVDHGVCFHAEPKLRTVIWEFAGARVPSALVRDLERIARDLRQGALRDSLGPLLSEGELDATARRAARLARTGRFPRPTTARPYPWPPV